MKTSVLISGQTRTFARCLASLHWNVFRQLDNPEFYVSVARDADCLDMELLRQKCPDSKVCIEYVDQPTLPEPDARYTLHAPYGITPTKTPGVGPFQGILRQYWSKSRAYKFALDNGAPGAKSDSVFVHCRTDLHFHRFIAPVSVRRDTVYSPWWGNYGPGINDRFGIMGAAVARSYFEAYDSLKDMLDEGCPFHPETFAGYSIQRAGGHISRSLAAEFVFVRPNGEWVPMQPSAAELAEYAAILTK